MNIYTVGFVYCDEATPRDEYFRTVKSDNEEEAKLFAWVDASRDDDRVMITGVMTDSNHR